MGSEDHDPWTFAAFTMTDQPDSSRSAARNHHSSAFWTFVNPLQQDTPVGNGNLLTLASDQLPAAAAINPYHPGNPPLINNMNHRYSPNPYDYPLESEFSRLSLTRATPPPAFIGRRTNSLNSLCDQLSPMDIYRMRIESAARAQQVQSQNFQNNLDFSDSLDAYRVRNYYGPLSNNSPVNLSLNGDMNRNMENLELTRSFQIQENNSGLRNGVVFRPQQSRIIAELKDLRGRILSVAKDQYGCKFLQSKLEEGNPEDIQMIFVEIKDHVHELMVDQIGSCLIQKFMDVWNQEQMNQLVVQLTNDQHKFAATCTDMHGTRSVQKLLEHVSTMTTRRRMISALSRIAVPLTKSPNAHHIIQYCLKCFSFEDTKYILNVVADHCLEIATDQHGCCVLQQCLGHAEGEPRHHLIAQITSNALMLSEHPYGNYVVQYVLGLKIRKATADILAQLAGNYVSLSFNKYGSNVVEKCLKDSEEHHIVEIIQELINSPNFVRVLQDPYGNYVGQSAIANSKGAIKEALIRLIHDNQGNLHSHPHGKRVLQSTKGGKGKDDHYGVRRPLNCYPYYYC